MIVDLSLVTFSNDFFSLPMPDGSRLIMNKINEDFNSEVVLKNINIVVASINGEGNILCPSVIGLGNKYLKINSDYEEYLGKLLNEDNMKYCTMEIFDNE